MNSQNENNYSLIVGTGATGLSIARFLQQKKQAFHFYDTRLRVPNVEGIKEEFSEAQVFLGDISEEMFLSAEELYLSPGVPRAHPMVARAVAEGISVVGDIELFLREVTDPVIGITGSNGKSTVTTLVGNAATASGFNVGVGGNIGIPALELLDKDRDLYVLELSSFQLESIRRKKISVACNLNVSADHMDRYESFNAYVGAKQNIFIGAECAIFNLDDGNTEPKYHVAMAYGFGSEDDTSDFTADRKYLYRKKTGDLLLGNDILLNKSDMRVKGFHNVQNALAVLAIGDAAGFNRDATKRALCEFTGLAHRCEFVAEIEEVSYINDSKATNVGASIAAISGLESEFSGIVLIAGGEGKGAEFSEFGECISECVRAVILIGKDRDDIARVLSEKTERFYADTLHQAVDVAKKIAKQGELVLLSPACASFDMFSGFEQRGEIFKRAVLSLSDEVSV